MLALLLLLYGLTYRYATRGTKNGQIKQGVATSFILTRALSKYEQSVSNAVSILIKSCTEIRLYSSPIRVFVSPFGMRRPFPLFLNWYVDQVSGHNSIILLRHLLFFKTNASISEEGFSNDIWLYKFARAIPSLHSYLYIVNILTAILFWHKSRIFCHVILSTALELYIIFYCCDF